MKKLQIDLLGISSATICLIHCIAFPLFSFLSFGFSDHYIIDTFFATIGFFVVSRILRSDASKIVKLILGISILLVIVSILLEIVFNIHTGLLLVGGLGMIIGHYLNFKKSKPILQ